MSIFHDLFHLCRVGSLVHGGTDTFVYFFLSEMSEDCRSSFLPLFSLTSHFSRDCGKSRTHDRSMTSMIGRAGMSTTDGRTNEGPLHILKSSKHPRSRQFIGYQTRPRTAGVCRFSRLHTEIGGDLGGLPRQMEKSSKCTNTG